MDEDLTRLWQIPAKALGPALKGAFQALWLAAGCEPNHIVVTATWLGSSCGGEPRTAWGWIQDLAHKGLLDIVERDERRGSIQLYLYRPSVVLGPAPGTGSGEVQGMLPLVYIPAEGVGPLCAQTPVTRAFVRANPRHSGLCARKGPSETEIELPQPSQSAESSGVCARKGPSDGPLCAQRPEPNSETHLISALAHVPAGASNRVESNRVDSTRIDSDRVESGRVGIGICGEDEDSIASRPITPVEAEAAAEACHEMETRWRRVGLCPARDADQRARDRSLIRRAHVLVQRGLLPECVLADAMDGPVEMRLRQEPVHKPMAVVNSRLYGHADFGRLSKLVLEPLPVERSPPVAPVSFDAAREAWEPLSVAGLPKRPRSPECAPNGEEPQRE